ncbi:MAG: VanZ family protein [Bacteroidota bacterium]|nr:VanZ family protein [Bacteroidota bacterium]MDP3144458.1 VanZ family protein [Bacteroidota bacterium]MDP3555864.1 VanZ family protein [Bacteroidota bacterium]
MKKLIYNNSAIFSFLWAAIIFVLCATPGNYIPTVSWLELLSFDKWVHASMFFILSSLLFLVVLKYNQSKKWMFIYFLICVSYGGLLEIMQAKCFTNRSADWQDFVANTFGCIIAFLFLKKLRKTFVNSTIN